MEPTDLYLLHSGGPVAVANVLVSSGTDDAMYRLEAPIICCNSLSFSFLRVCQIVSTTFDCQERIEFSQKLLI